MGWRGKLVLLFKQKILAVLLILIWAIPVVGADNIKSVEIEKLPTLGNGIVFPNHLLMKVSDQINFLDFDNETEEYSIYFNNLLVNDLKNIPDIFLNRIPQMKILETDAVFFKSLIKNEYYFSDKWADKNHILSISHFEKTGSQSDISTYLGPLSNIPTSLHGLATFQLKFEDTKLSFKSYASKKLFSLKKQYWAYFGIYVPPKQYAEQLKVIILIASEPNNYLKDNGTYFIIPITENDRKRYSLQ